MACASTSSASHSSKESLEDCMCTICLCILVHPVTLPCHHELCMPCFKKTLEEASLSCPLCRTRISTWARKASRTKTLVDQKRWEQIQKLFPQRVQRRLDGLDDETDEEIQEKEDVDVGYRRMLQLSEPGEIRKEYEEEIKRLQAQQEEERQKEEEASASLIHNLRSVEEQRLQVVRHQQEEIAARDAQLAEELGRLINTVGVGSETPVNRLLQESQTNYPNLPLPPSTPTVVLTPQDGSHSKRKQPLTKNSNKTLETFFRRLPAGAKRSVRSSSEPKTGGGSEAAGRKNCSGAVSPRCQSAPVRGKENLPLVSNSDAIHILDDASFYQNLDSSGSSHDVKIDDPFIIDEGQGEVIDTHDDGVEIVNSGQERAGSPSVAPSDSLDSVIVCEEEQEAGGEDEEERGDPLFRPIHTPPGTVPQKQANSVPLQPCLVCITPRVLFSTNRFSSSNFPILPSPAVHRNAPSAGVGRTGVSAQDHSQKRVGDRLRWADRSGHSRTGSDMGSQTSKLFKDGATSSRHAVSGARSNQGRFTRRARSSSPPASGQQVCGQEQGAFCRPSLQEHKTRRKPSSHSQEVVSDSEVTWPSPRCRLRPGRLAMGRTMSGAGGREVEGVAGHGQADSDTEEESSDGEGEEHQPRLSPTAHSAAPLARQAQTIRWAVSQGVGDVGSVPSTGGSVGGKSTYSPYREEDSPAVSPEPWERCPSPRPAGIFNPDTLPPWSGVLYADSSAVDSVKGKGKRLLKSADGRGLSHRNCPKNSRKAPAPSTSEEEEGSCHGAEKSQAPRSPAHPHSAAPHAGSPRTERDVLPAAVTDVHAEVPTVRQVCRKRRTPTYRKNRRHPALKETSQPARVSQRVNRHQTIGSFPHAGKADKTSKTALNSDKTHEVDKHQTKSKPSVADKTSSEAALNSNRGRRVGRKSSQCSIVAEKSEASGVHQRSIKDWFSPSSSEEVPEPFYSHRRTPNSREVKTSETSVCESDVSRTSSAADIFPSKVILRTSQRARKINPKLEDFWLTNCQKLSQFSKDPYSDSDTTPMSTPMSTPTKNLKRKPEDEGGRDGSPVKKSRKQSPHPSPQKRPASSVGGRAGSSGQSSQLGGDHEGHTPQKLACRPLSAGGEDGLSAEEEEGLSQEETDGRLALRLQQQFELADKLRLSVVRFKGTDDQYSLRRSRAERNTSKQ